MLSSISYRLKFTVIVLAILAFPAAGAFSASYLYTLKEPLSYYPPPVTCEEDFIFDEAANANVYQMCAPWTERSSEPSFENFDPGLSDSLELIIPGFFGAIVGFGLIGTALFMTLGAIDFAYRLLNNSANENEEEGKDEIQDAALQRSN